MFLRQLFSPQGEASPVADAGSPASARRGGGLSPVGLETICVAALVVCVALRFVALGSQSLWADELFSVFWSKGGAHYVLSHAASETNPPLYYLVLGLWMRLCGDSEAAVRLLSACVSAVTVAVVFLMGRALFNRGAAFIAALLFALSPWQLYFAQEARAFALLNLAFAILLWSTYALAARLRRGAPVRHVLRSPPAAGFLLSAAACAYLHYAAFLIFGTVGISVLLVWWLYFRFDRTFLACFAVLGGIVAVLSATSLALAVWQRHSASVAWMSFPSTLKLLGLLMGAPAWSSAPDWVLGGVILLSVACAGLWAAVLGYGAARYRRDIRFVLIYLMPCMGFCVLTVASFSQPFLFPRTALWLSIPVYLGLGGAVAAIVDRRARGIVAAAVILSSAVFTGGYFAFPSKEPWRAIVHGYQSILRKGDVLVLPSNTPAVAFVYYRGGGAVPDLRRWPDAPATADRLDERVTGIRLMTGADIRDASLNNGRFFFLSRACEAPSFIPRAQVNFIFDCKGKPITGWDLIGAFLRHAGVGRL
jgi:hypothetical protein